MQKVYVYVEENYGDLIGDCRACSEVKLFSTVEKVKEYLISEIKKYAGIVDNDDDGINYFYVEQAVLDTAEISIEEETKLTDNQIHRVVENEFNEEFGCNITLLAYYNDNYDEFFIINISLAEIE